ncbi:DUF3427 domain-containing protein [Staphylococcus massiliensis]|uniref:DUF3427 domain-containing protein n=1 Tax=Staphylococcus massiliensis TaxID=555791 RepID=UPI00370D4D8B
MEKLIKDFNQSLQKGFIDRSISHQGNFAPKLLINNKKENVLSTIIDELHKCREFTISVAFITESGLASLKSHLYDLNQKGVKGRILTSNYLGFNSPKMFRELLKLDNIDVRLTDIKGFHAKGYIFDHENYSTLIVGSSNLTSDALKQNYEQNLFLSTHKNGDLIYHVKQQFEKLWNDSFILNEEWIKTYEETFQYQKVKDFKQIVEIQKEAEKKLTISKEIVPNIMQEEALNSLRNLRDKKADKALIISATGTGKTILCALDVRAYQPERTLFIVHNEGILKKAIEEFKKVLPFEDDNEFGLLTGKNKKIDAKYVFATVQTISKPDVYKKFSENHFDYVIFDEAHRSAARSYLRVYNYFKPKFLLGMTATPERTDERNIFEMFDYNIAYEIRLQKALESEILCPFHYFGVTEYVKDEVEEDDPKALQKLASDERVHYILEKTHYYGYSGDVLKGLIFVNNVSEAKELATKLTSLNVPTVALSGEDSQVYRDEVMQQLKDGVINYIITVDLFNEGIDIPEVNQVIMLRATKSSIIFIQQLGRGLRKSTNKDYVTVIDFIGNYDNNYLIPIALSGDQSQNKDNYRKFLTDNTVLDGVSTINFEAVAKTKIFESLNKVSLNGKLVIKNAFNKLKERLGRTPMLMDFVEQHSIDPNVILDNFKNYYEFLRYVKCMDNVLTSNESKNLTMLSREIMSGIRDVDYLVLQSLVRSSKNQEELLEDVRTKRNTITLSDVDTALRIFDFSYFKNDIEKTYGKPLIETNGEKIRVSKTLVEAMKKPPFNLLFEDIMKVSMFKNINYHNSSSELELYKKYTRKDVIKILNWKSDESGVVNGYKMKYQTCPIFINYHKEDDISENTQYEDRFLSQDEMKWFTRSPRKLTSSEVQPILNHKESNSLIYLFVKKESAEGMEYYYLGKANVIDGSAEEDHMPNGKSVVTMRLGLETPVRDDIYRYIVQT